MASPPLDSRRVLEGVFAINKPQWASSAGVLRDLQTHFQTSTLFAPWLESQRRNMLLSNSKPKALRNLKVKVGHGGTLDPLATGVLIVGVGKGTKYLGKFLECTKSYECVVLFGAATDSYDGVGKIVSRAPYEHVTRELVEERLQHFRGKIMQKPSVFSALKVDGKKMYEYARAGGHVPEVAARPVEVKELELVEFLESGSHHYTWPDAEVGDNEKASAEQLMGIRAKDAASAESNARGRKRSRSPADQIEDMKEVEAPFKRPRTSSERTISISLLGEDPQSTKAAKVASVQASETFVSNTQPHQEVNTDPSSPRANTLGVDTSAFTSKTPSQLATGPPAARLRMTVTSGFYVRSLCHDLGIACSSLGLMSSLIRTRQGDYALGSNVVEFFELESGPAIWEPKVQKQLEDFMTKEGWEAETIETEEAWEEGRKRREDKRRESDGEQRFGGRRERKGGGKWNHGRDRGRDH